MAERWRRHIESWQSREGVCYISYEQMRANFRQVLDRIASHLRLPVEHVVEPPLGGITPWRGRVGNWREYFTADDEVWFNAAVGEHLAEEVSGFGTREP